MQVRYVPESPSPALSSYELTTSTVVINSSEDKIPFSRRVPEFRRIPEHLCLRLCYEKRDHDHARVIDYDESQ